VYDFARKPLWVLSHVLVAVAVLVMVRLGFWQMDRWHEESDRQDAILAGAAEAPVPLDEVVPDPSVRPREVPEDARFRRVVVEGTWAADDDVLVRGRSLQGSPGGWLVTPLVQADGTAVPVVRGWVPLDVVNGGVPVAAAPAATGPVTVTGLVGLTQVNSGLGASDPAEGRLETLARLDLDRYAEQASAPLEPVYVVAQESTPAEESEVVQSVPTEVPSPSQNFSYMVQWWVFAAIAAGGYVLILRRVARQRSGTDRRSQVPVEDAPELPTAAKR
jgi:cytochrome oxidase assembly protein ShyY1